jgi:hypothetical protein
VFSLDRSRPITGATRWRRSASRRIAPVVKRIRPRSRRRILKRGNPTRRPQRRRPCLESASCVRPRPDRQSHRRRPPWSTAPPRGDLVLGLVPVAVDGGKTPRQCGDRRVGRAGVQVGLHPGQRPVVGEPASTEMLADR